jgi:dipeptidyl aminopeptidase/acylaminoacyl peptidase
MCKIPLFSKIKYQYRSDEISFKSGSFTISGRLYLPIHKKFENNEKSKQHKSKEGIKNSSFPVVILVHGSGPHDRDETIGPNKPFKDIAQGLAGLGTAVLTYDKRTYTYAREMASMIKELTLEHETLMDIHAAVKFLRACNQKDIDRENIFILGHSLGGYAIPAIAAENTSCSGFIILAGNSRPLEELIVEQYRYIFNLDSKISDKEKILLNKIEKSCSIISKGEFNLNTPAADLNNYKPLKMIVNEKRPILILQGARDYQVTPKDFNSWKQALENNSNLSFKLFDNLNHLFMAGKNKSTPAEYTVPGHVDNKVIVHINDLINSVKK